MSERTIFIRSDPLRVVVKPHPGKGRTAGNAFGLENHAAAVAYAASLSEAQGWPVVDESEGASDV